MAFKRKNDGKEVWVVTLSNTETGIMEIMIFATEDSAKKKMRFLERMWADDMNIFVSMRRRMVLE